MWSCWDSEHFPGIPIGLWHSCSTGLWVRDVAQWAAMSQLLQQCCKFTALQPRRGSKMQYLQEAVVWAQLCLQEALLGAVLTMRHCMFLLLSSQERPTGQAQPNWARWNKQAAVGSPARTGCSVEVRSGLCCFTCSYTFCRGVLLHGSAEQSSSDILWSRVCCPVGRHSWDWKCAEGIS